MQTLPRSFYAQDTVRVARALLGKPLVHNAHGLRRIGKIVEVEAYLGAHDRAAHSSRGVTRRTQVMFGPPGFAYIYLVYGIHCCMNVVTEPEGHGSAVLLRAIEPLENVVGRTQGPGLLCRAMGVDRSLNAQDLTGERLFITAAADLPPQEIVSKPRIGVENAGAWAVRFLRYYIRGNRFVSKP